MTKLQSQLQQAFPALNFQYQFPLKQISYFRVGGPADVLVVLDQRKNIIDLVKFCLKNKIKFTILGGVSNVIVSDEGIRGLVLCLTHDHLEVLDQKSLVYEQAKVDDNSNIVQVDAGIKMPILVKKTVDLGLTGLESFFGVPGTLGGAIYNNAHYLDALISQFVLRVEIINQQGEIEWLDHQHCAFAYDQSRFQESKEVILRVDFKLSKGNKEVSERLINQAIQYRAQTQPLGMPSSGCVFQNVLNNQQLRQIFPQFQAKEYLSAGLLIDQAGLKGRQIGQMIVSDKHANFIVNLGEGKTNDLIALIKEIKQVIKDKYQVDLKEEVVFLR